MIRGAPRCRQSVAQNGLILEPWKAALWRRRLMAGSVTSDAGALLLGATDRAIGLVDRFAACFRDRRRQDLIEHAVTTLVGQRVFGIALGYEDLNDHDELRHDPVMAVLAGKLTARRAGLRAGGRQIDAEPAGAEPGRSRRAITRSPTTRRRSRRCSVTLFLEAHTAAAQADHPRSRRHRRSAARPSGGPLLPRLLRLLLLSAALRVLRPASAGRQAAALRHRRQPRAASRRSRGSSGRSAPAGRRCASCCGPTRALPARR